MKNRYLCLWGIIYDFSQPMFQRLLLLPRTLTSINLRVQAGRVGAYLNPLTTIGEASVKTGKGGITWGRVRFEHGDSFLIQKRVYTFQKQLKVHCNV